MNLLVLGGTRFLGRHFVEVALASGHAVTIFTRGRAVVPWQDRVRRLAGDRDPAVAPGLAALVGRTWDVVIDCSGYIPRCVRASAGMLAGAAGQYLFVSSMSVYTEPVIARSNEAEPLASLGDPESEDVIAHYGALKAACEREVVAAFGARRATVIRPGLIVGPHDHTDRFGYWVARFAAPELLGDRSPGVVVPAPPERPIQFIDARDLAAWMLALVEGRTPGIYNACSEAGQWTMGDLVEALTAAALRRGRSAHPVWVDEGALLAAGVEPWTGLPLWIPGNDPAMAAFLEIGCRLAHRAGLAERPLAATIDDSLQWLLTRDNAGAWQKVLTAAAERAILPAH